MFSFFRRKKVVLTAYEIGANAYRSGKLVQINPYKPGTTDFFDWDKGWWGAAFADCPTDYKKLFRET